MLTKHKTSIWPKRSYCVYARPVGDNEQKMKRLIQIIIVIFLQNLCLGQNEQFDSVQQFSEEIEFVLVHEFLMNSFYPLDTTLESRSSFGDFLHFSKSLSIDEIERCLNDESPKIRALGLLSLYQSDNQVHLIRTADFLRDSAICFKRHPQPIIMYPYANGPKSKAEARRREKERNKLLKAAKHLTVADLAKAILQFYFEQSRSGDFDQKLDLFLEERRNLEYTAGFLRLLETKAKGDISPLQEKRQPLVEELRGRIESISNKLDRAIYKIYLAADIDGYELFSKEELLAELTFLGRERVKMILIRQPPTNDPDLLNEQDSELYNFGYNRICEWILMNAQEIFNQNDVPFFLERAKYERENTRSWRTTMNFPFWYIAAARVDEINSSEYLKSSIKLFGNEHQEFERATLCAELWHRKGLEEVNYILNWIYDSYALNERSRERIDIFIHHLDQKEDIILLKRIISDDRFEQSMNVWNIIQVAWQINKLKGDNTVEDHFTRKIWHPLGLGRVERWRKKALENYPNETKEMLERTKILIDELSTIE